MHRDRGLDGGCLDAWACMGMHGNMRERLGPLDDQCIVTKSPWWVDAWACTGAACMTRDWPGPPADRCVVIEDSTHAWACAVGCMAGCIDAGWMHACWEASSEQHLSPHITPTLPPPSFPPRWGYVPLWAPACVASSHRQRPQVGQWSLNINLTHHSSNRSLPLQPPPRYVFSLQPAPTSCWRAQLQSSRS